jgi:hypothetical protein
MTKTELFQLSATRITVSTVAPTPDAFMEFVDSKCVLAWSVHAVSIIIGCMCSFAFALHILIIRC